MAKISAKGCHEITSFNVEGEVENDHFGGTTERYFRFVLRSDGAVLRKLCVVHRGTSIGTYRSDGSYSIWATIKDPTKRTAEQLRASLERRGFKIVAKGHRHTLSEL